MTNKIDRILDRLNDVPLDIIERSATDAYICAAVSQWAKTDQTVEQLLVRLVLLLSDLTESQTKTIERMLIESPPRMRL